MLGRENPQVSLFSTDHLLEHLFGEDTFYAKLARHGSEIVTDDDFADCYHPTHGRPSVPPATMTKVVLLALHDRCSDREAARRTVKDLDWKHALHLEIDDDGIHPTTISVFRARLLLHDADRRIFDAVLARAVEAKLFPKHSVALVDSSPILGAAAVKDTYELVRQAIGKLRSAAGEETLTKRVRRATRRYRDCSKPKIDWQDPTARRKELAHMVAGAKALLQATADREELAGERELLARIVDQDIEESPKDGGGPQIRRGVAKDRIVSVVDPEMRHGRKSASKTFTGYKVHLAEDAQTELITAVDVGGAPEWDGRKAASLVGDAAQVGAPVREVVGDMAYGDGDTRAEVAAQGVRIVAKVPPRIPTGRFTREEFTVSPAGRAATCPAGVRTTERRTVTDHKGRPVTQFVFGESDCGGCALRSRCTAAAGPRVLTIGFHDAAMQRARSVQNTPAVKRKLRLRPGVERKIAEMKSHGMGKARYRGKRRILAQARSTAAMVNLKRLFTLDVFERRARAPAFSVV